MKIFNQKVTVKQLLTTAWITFSIPFVIWVLWAMGLNAVFVRGVNQGAQQGIQRGVQKGYATAVEEIVAQANNENCAPFPVNIGETVVNLVNLSCLQQATTPQQPELPIIEDLPVEEATE